MLTCSNCPRTYPESEPRWRCDCGGDLRYRSEGLFCRDRLVHRPATMWRFREALGITCERDIVSLGEGFTPLLPSQLGGCPVLLKLDFMAPTGSYKDRGSTVMVSKLKEWGITEILEDSSGNAGASIAAYASAAGIHARILVPASTPEGKMAQIAAYGAELVKVNGTREEIAAAAVDAASDIFYASHNWNPYFLAGMKTLAFEICEQLGWEAPEWVVAPVGNGGLLLGLHLGFMDLVRGGIIARAPALIAVQAKTCDPVCRAWAAGLDYVPPVIKGDTAADGISIAAPVRGKGVLEALRESRGFAHAVEEESIWSALHTLGRRGLYVEPTSASAAAAAVDLIGAGVLHSGQRIVIVLTGSGLKATDKIALHRREG
jgi:threonine synthase